ncbi:MAG TPA: DCC1-like thiol-disulfide oxidoreductase family protein [Vicinamibacterales bacterium]|nr:DCC1-like thiol-disulfide oxidoreductase family protein [Vicinamibacterales bacterium]
MASPVLLFDSGCGLCRWSVAFVLRHERRHTLRFAGLDSGFARDILARHPAVAALDTVVWYQPAAAGRAERILVKSSAVLEVFRYLGGFWRAALVATALPRRWLDALYGLVSHHRHRFFTPRARSAFPPPAYRHRFLD